MKLKELMNFEMDKNKKSSLQVKAVKGLIVFLILMFLLTILSRAADSITIAKVNVVSSTGGTISHNIEAEGSVLANKDIAISANAGIKIASVEVIEGKSVKKGDLLMQLDTDDLKKQFLQAQKDLAVLQATASDKAANEAIAEREKQKALNRLYEDYNQTVADADDTVNKAKKEMDAAWNTYNNAKNNGNHGNSDTTVYEALAQTVAEKQTAYDKAVKDLDGIEKDIEAAVQKAISEKENTPDAEGNKVTLTQAEKQAIRDQINALPENQSMITSARTSIDNAKNALAEAEAALSTYEDENNQNNQSAAEEQLRALYSDYEAKKSAYEDALKQHEVTIKNANRTLEDANAPENVDTASQLTENNDLELKKLEVEQLQKMIDDEGKVVSPTDGLVTKVQVTTGETTTEDIAVRIADQSSGYKFKTSLDKSVAKFLNKGDKITLDIGNGTTVQGLTIDSLDISAADKNTYELSVSIPSKVQNLGSIATMKVEKPSKRYDTCVSLNVLHSDGNNYYVYVVNQKETILGTETAVDKVQVEVLDKNNEQAAIEGAFGWNQQFVLSSSKTLRNGDRVRIVEGE